ncbi:hypothetical protein ACIP5Y_07940 [Nocardia sp. NPDC088792]|uniref:hypothetical protein n=1 Tax=Nocardia sp. NPDC088792 TaxID=3364332 RepID=UPI003818D721
MVLFIGLLATAVAILLITRAFVDFGGLARRFTDRAPVLPAHLLGLPKRTAAPSEQTAHRRGEAFEY